MSFRQSFGDQHVVSDPLAAPYSAAFAVLGLQELSRDLRLVRDQLRQVAARKKNLQDLNDQLDVPLHVLLDPNFETLHSSNPAETSTTAPGSSTAISTAAPAGGGCAPEAMNWRTQRLECLMYRVLWVSEAIKMFKDSYTAHSGSRSYALFLRSSSWAKTLSESYDGETRSCLTMLDHLRIKLADLACVDHASAVANQALEAIR